jgi:hypothetical protein
MMADHCESAVPLAHAPGSGGIECHNDVLEKVE